MKIKQFKANDPNYWIDSHKGQICILIDGKNTIIIKDTSSLNRHIFDDNKLTETFEYNDEE